MRNKFILVLLVVVITTITLKVIKPEEAPQTSAAAQESDGPGSSRLAGLLGANASDGFPMVLEPRVFEFPIDHGPHPEFRNEWWYITGNLDDREGARFGFELTLFRFAQAPQSASKESHSNWATNHVFVGHFAVTDVTANRFHVAQRSARGAAGLAGAQAVPFRVWVENWEIATTEAGDSWRLSAMDGDIALELELRPAKTVVLNGYAGLSQKSAEAGNASYYYSMTRLRTSGQLRVGEKLHDVEGLSWLDREWGSSALADYQDGWDWYALQLSDGSELMFYSIRQKDGTQDPHSAGTLVRPDGGTIHLSRDQVNVRVTNYWQNAKGDRYPMGWHIALPGYDLSLDVTPVIENQELSSLVRYWEGAVDVIGQSGGGDITGRGYVEMTGYAE